MKTKSRLICPSLVLLLCAFFLFYEYVLQVSPSVITKELMSVFHLSGAGLGNLAATFFYAYLVTQIFAGPLLDKYGVRLLMSAAIACCGLGAIWFSTAMTLHSALLSRSLIGVGAAFATVGYFKVASTWFKPEQFALLSGLLATAAMIGSMTGQAPLALMVTHLGWRASLLYCGLFGVCFSILFFMLVRVNTPSADQSLSLVEAETVTFRQIISVLRHKHNWLLMLYSGLAFAPLVVFGGLWGDGFLQTAYHLTKPGAASLTSLSFLGLGIGAPVLGYISDRLRLRYSVMALGLLLSVVSLSVALYAPNLSSWTEGVTLFVFGFGTGAFMLGFTLGKEINPITLTATVVAFINTGDAIFGTFTEPLVGKLLDIFGHGVKRHGVYLFSVHDYHLSFFLLPAYLVLALFFLFWLRKSMK